MVRAEALVTLVSTARSIGSAAAERYPLGRPKWGITVKPLPSTEDTLALRTDFADDGSWRSIRDAISAPVGEFRAYVEFVDDPSYAGASVEQLVASARRGARRSFFFVIDRVTISDPEHPVLVVDLDRSPGRTLRVIPSELWGIENNLSLANMDFAEFADAADADGVFRGFRA